MKIVERVRQEIALLIIRLQLAQEDDLSGKEYAAIDKAVNLLYDACDALEQR